MTINYSLLQHTVAYQTTRLPNYLLLFLLLPCTCVRAQLQPDPVVLTYLADELPEMSLSWGHPNGDLGPTRLAITRQMLVWQPSHLAASWRGDEQSFAGIGAFTPYERNYNYDRSTLSNRLALAPGLLGLRSEFQGNNYNGPYLSVSLLNDQRAQDLDEDDANDFNNRRTLFLTANQRWSNRSYNGNVNLLLLDEENTFQGGEQALRTSNRRYQLTSNHHFDTGDVKLFAGLWASAENFDRNTSLRNHDGRRLSGVVTTGVRNNRYRNIHWSASADLVHTDDRLVTPNLFLNRQERYIALNGSVKYNYNALRIQLHQQLRSGANDVWQYRPNLRLGLYNPERNLRLQGVVSRGGGYRNPLFSDAYTANTNRRYDIDSLATEDFWRTGITGKADLLSKDLQLDFQAIHFNYTTFTTLRYATNNRLAIENQPDVSRKLLSAQATYILPVRIFNRRRPSISLNYRYDELDLPDAEGILLPARHSILVRLSAVGEGGGYKDRWIIHPTVSYLRQGKVRGLAEDLNEGRSRLDATLRVQYRSYWIAFSGEQLLRKGPFFAYGFDTSMEGNFPLGNTFSALAGRSFTVSAGVGIGQK